MICGSMHELKYAQKIFEEMKKSKNEKNNFLIKVTKNHDTKEIEEMLKDMIEYSGEKIKFSIEPTPIKIKCEYCDFVGNVDMPFSTVGFRAICPSCKKNRTKIISEEIEVKHA